jgi:hypothetical protein
MKKQVKKLKLAKETVRNLSFGLGHVAGGATIGCTALDSFTCGSCPGWTCATCETKTNGAICPGTMAAQYGCDA